MKKTIYGLIVAALGAVIGVGGAYFFGLNKPAAPVSANGAPPAATTPAKRIEQVNGRRKST
jgi:hypothetical protein